MAKKKTVELYNFSELSPEAQQNVIKRERRLLEESGDVPRLVIDDDYLLEPPHKDLVTLFGEDFYEKLNASSKYKDSPMIANEGEVYFDTEAPYRHIDASKAIEIRNSEYFLRYLGIPKEMVKKVDYQIKSDESRYPDTIIEFSPKGKEEFTDEENSILDVAEKKFKSYMDQVLKNIEKSIEYTLSDEAIKEHILANEDEDNPQYLSDGSSANFQFGGIINMLSKEVTLKEIFSK